MSDLDSVVLVDLTAELVASYVVKNAVRPADMPDLIALLHRTLVGLGQAPAEAVPEAAVPAVPIKKSVTDDHIVCLEDGLKFQTMKRHLAGLGMTPEQYRTKWGLPDAYPMVAPGYAKRRSELAKSIGLGRKSAATTDPDAVEVTAEKRERPVKAA